ncbi:glycosyltransferase family 39 protein [Candidatus Leptofilum sp.]|uniref:glycosyltransferase family 39 protein n=1 Tax=Candidatus Leptofilum sp. TaxID=3241576 RepID=UPI003B5A11EF
MTAVFKNSRLQLGFLIVLGAVLRLLNLDRDSLWLDEAISYLAAGLPVAQIANNTVQSSHPPLYYFLLHFWLKLIPNSDTAVKLLSTLFGILLIPAIYILSQQFFKNRTVSTTAAALTAVSPFHILYSHELRMYTLLMLLVVGGTAAYTQARQKQSSDRWLAAGGLFLLAVYTHLFAFLALAGVGLHALLNYGQNKRAFWTTVAMTAVILICFVPWLNLMLAEADPALGSLRPLQQATNFNPLKPITAPVFLLFGMSSSFWYSGLILFSFFAYGIIFLMELRKIERSQISSGLRLTLLIIICVLGVPLGVYVVRPYFLPERTLAAAAPFLIILLAWGVTRRQSPLPYLTGLATLLMVIGTISYHLGPMVKPPYRSATNHIVENAQPEDLVLHTSDGSYLPALRYAPQLNQGVLAGDPDPRKPTAVYTALGGQVYSLADLETVANGRFWAIVALEHSIEWQQTQYDAIAASHTLLDEQEIGGIRIFLFEQGTK